MSQHTPADLKAYLSQGKIRKVIDLLLVKSKSVEEGDMHNEMIALSGRHNTLLKEERQSLLSQEEVKRERANINKALLSIIDELPENAVIHEVVSFPFNKIMWIAAVVLAGVLIAWLMNRQPADTDSFSVTFNVHGPKGRMDMLLENQGKLFMDISGDRREALIGDKGQVVFQSIPSEFKNKEVAIGLEAKDYQLARPNALARLADETIYLEIQTACLFCQVAGNVRNQQAFIAGAIVSIEEWTDTTDQRGRFEIHIPPEREKKEYTLIVQQEGKIVWENFVSPSPGQDVEVLVAD